MGISHELYRAGYGLGTDLLGSTGILHQKRARTPLSQHRGRMPRLIDSA